MFVTKNRRPTFDDAKLTACEHTMRAYFAVSAGGAPLTIIKQYIEQQNRP